MSARANAEAPAATTDARRTALWWVVVVSAVTVAYHLAGGLALRPVKAAAVAALICAFAGAAFFAAARGLRGPAAPLLPALLAFLVSSLYVALFVLDARNWVAAAAILLSAFAASYAAGLGAGIGVAVSSSASLASAWMLTGAPSLSNAPFLLFAGLALARAGAARAEERRRSRLLFDVTRISNPRFGVERTLGLILEKLRAHFGAHSCLLIGEEGADAHASAKCVLQRVDCRRNGSPIHSSARHIPAAAVANLLAIPTGAAALFDEGRAGIWRRLRGAKPVSKLVWLAGAAGTQAAAVPLLQDVAEELEASSFISISVRSGGGSAKIYVVRREGARPFGEADLSFLALAAEAFAPAVENIRLLDQMVSESAGRERRRIARDLHDTTIQPVIGLKMGLAAVREKLSAGRAGEATAQVEQLIALTEAELGSLRGYVTGLCEGEAPKTSFLTAVRHFAEKFEESSGIPVSLEVEGELEINDRLAAETFQMVAEGLSNVRRHTGSKGARVRLACENGLLLLEISNWGCDRAAARSQFRPRSLSERAQSLGGELEVVADDQGTRLNITIPL